MGQRTTVFLRQCAQASPSSQWQTFPKARRRMTVLWVIVGFLFTSCAGQSLNDTYGGLIIEHVRAESSPAPVPTAQWNQLKRYSMHYGGVASSSAAGEESTAQSNVSLLSESLSSRAMSGVVGGIKLIILAFRVIGEFLRKFGAELRVAKCLLMYSLTFQPLSAKVASGTIVNWLTGYFGAEDARDLYRFLSRNLFAQLGLSGADV
ncbi:uncharacterized protein LOC133393847 [Anopheles gambiae]|uniref:Uncharacterized protein n=1 Tax=Anopheles coluzzii TaxID=1518534 RepID=A0ABM2BCX3_ANOCL|nr:uncharacterized protein LOC120958667 [Anopheles coluzzii]XP_061516642.1 uncharacterized protein LOC133393847 [Anopheles gambiae]